MGGSEGDGKPKASFGEYSLPYEWAGCAAASVIAGKVRGGNSFSCLIGSPGMSAVFLFLN